MPKHKQSKPHKGKKIAALATIGVALVATGNVVGYLLLAVIVGYIFAL